MRPKPPMDTPDESTFQTPPAVLKVPYTTGLIEKSAEVRVFNPRTMMRAQICLKNSFMIYMGKYNGNNGRRKVNGICVYV